jgi:hypothetical protein
LIAGAGVVGLAIGFGAQKLVQDIITGIFIQLENGMNQNDVVAGRGRVRHGREDHHPLGRHPHAGRRLPPGPLLVGGRRSPTTCATSRTTWASTPSPIARAWTTPSSICARAFAELMTRRRAWRPRSWRDITVAGVTALNETGV